MVNDAANDPAAGEDAPKFLHDNFLEWCHDQPVPVIEDFGIDLMTIQMDRWDFFGMNGAICLLKGRDDFISIFGFELAPGGKSRPMSHVYEDVIYVLSGQGSTVVESADGRKHSFEWGTNSLFAIPLNARHQHFNGSGQEPARFASVHNFPYLINLFRNEEFIFNNPVQFPERHGKDGYFAGEGELKMVSPGRHQWETNFVTDICNFELKSWDKRGPGSTSLRWVLSDGTLGCHTSEIPGGTYKKGHSHMGGVNVFAVNGRGYSLLWYDEGEYTKVDWQHGVVCAPPEKMFHQHFNINADPSRYLAIQMGTIRYPLTQVKKNLWGGKGVDTSVEDGGLQLEYENQDPRIHRIWLDAIAETGVESQMGGIFDEDAIRKMDL